jgi:uncharacterized SAM-binding protein YcdF (DUF218 family)
MYRFLVDLLQPHTLFVLWVCLALLYLWRRRNDPKRRLWPLVVPLSTLAVLSSPAVAYLALRSLESYAPPLQERPADAGAIVVFSAGVYPPEGPRQHARMDEDSLERCLTAARLYHQRPCLVLVSGGRVEEDEPGPSYAAVLGDFLEQLGVRRSDLLLEEKSRTTYENAAESAELLAERHIDHVVLVVDAVDMHRAAGCLRKQGIAVTPAPCHFRATRFRYGLSAFVPGPGGAAGVERVWHEWLGTVWYWWHGRL